MTVSHIQFKGINKKYKGIYINRSYIDGEIYRLISNNDVNPGGCWWVMDDQQSFKKMRNGYSRKKK